jgi:hypothetical protein
MGKLCSSCSNTTYLFLHRNIVPFILHVVESSPRLAAESTGWVGQCIELKDCLQNGAITSSALEKPDESPLWCPGARAASTAQRVLGLPVFEWLLLTIYYGMRTVERTLQGIATFNAQPGLRASTEPQRSWFYTCDVTMMGRSQLSITA